MRAPGPEVGVIAVDAWLIGDLARLRVWRKLRGMTSSERCGVNVLQKTAVSLTPNSREWEHATIPRLNLALYAEYVRRFGRPDLIHAHTGKWSGVSAREISRLHGIP